MKKNILYYLKTGIGQIFLNKESIDILHRYFNNVILIMYIK